MFFHLNDEGFCILLIVQLVFPLSHKYIYFEH